LSLLPSYNKLGFIQKTIPTNYTNVLREGFSYGDDPVDIAARAAVVREMHNETRRVFIATTGRSLHVCANCESADSYSWHPVRDIDNDHGDKICRRCEVYYKTYNEYPTPEELDRLAAKTAKLAAFAENPPPPGVCQNDKCAMDGKSTWHWSFVHARENNDELRIPQRHKRASRKEGLPCANNLCGVTAAQRWAWSIVKNGHVCNACSKWFQRLGVWPDRLSGKDLRKTEKGKGKGKKS
ncbi:hypothetical protein D6C89_10829, partial [Aureobasidium pullulans]